MADTQTLSLTLASPLDVVFKSADGTERTESLTQLTLRKPVTRDLRAMDRADGDMASMIALIAELSGQPAKVIDRLETADFFELSALVSPFLRRSPATGETSSET